MDEGRYTRQPMLRLLDSYVLDALGALDADSGADLRAGKPQFEAALGVVGATWQEVVEQAMGLPDDAQESVRSHWAGYESAARAQGGEPDPLAYAHRFVDANLR